MTPRFTISDIVPSGNAGGVLAEFTLRTSIGVMPATLVRRANGEEFVSGPSIRDRFSPNGWRVFVQLDAAFAAEVYAEVIRQMRGVQNPTFNHDGGAA